MITKREYKKTLIRIWDTARIDDKYKGANDCSSVECEKCPVTSLCGNYMDNMNNAYELIEFVEQWGKEHPIETNGSRFLKNYPKAEVYDCNYVEEFVYVRLDEDANENGIFPVSWWESEADDADCD